MFILPVSFARAGNTNNSRPYLERLLMQIKEQAESLSRQIDSLKMGSPFSETASLVTSVATDSPLPMPTKLGAFFNVSSQVDPPTMAYYNIFY